MITLKETIEEMKQQVTKFGEHVSRHPVPYIIGGVGTACAVGYTIYARSKTTVPEPAEPKSMIASAAESVGRVATDISETTKSAVDSVSEKARDLMDDKPLLIGAGVLAAGVLAGLLIPLSGKEDRILGAKKKDMIERAKAAGHEAIEESQRFARETIEEADRKVKQAVEETGKAIRERIASLG